MKAHVRTAACAVSVLVVAGAAASPMLAQGRLLDEGTFVITRSGAPAGRESFRIAQVPSASGPVYRATAQISLGNHRLSPTLTTDTLGAPIAYDISVRGGPNGAEQLQARTRPGRFSAVLQTSHGESAKEYVVPQRTVVLDDDIFHQYYFLGRAGPGAVTVLFPLASTDAVAHVSRRGEESLSVGGTAVPAVRYTVTVPGGPARDFWLDSAGRVLRVAIPDRGILAQRDELPR
jgi:hypothetical protein